MPRYKYNPDGTLTIIDNSPNSHQPSPGRNPRPTDRRNGQDHSNNGFPVLRARIHVLLVLLGIVAVIFMLVSCSDTGGEFAHKMTDEAWSELKASEASHNVAEQMGKGLEGHDSTGGVLLSNLGKHDWTYGLGLLGPGTQAIFDNMGYNLNELGEMMESGLDDFSGTK